MFEKLRVIIDVQTANARKAMSDFGASIRSADGVAGKFKAGWASASESIRANAASIAVTAGAALVAFGVKALAAFEKTSKAALDFGKATGLTTEAASRWIAVADDFGVSAGALQTAMGKAAKQGLDFRDVLDQINAAAPGDRARVAAELLGKSWQSIAPLLGKTRAEYEKMLGAVEDGQVITEAEAKKAERMRLAQDALSDALKEVTLAVGEQVAELAPYVEYLAKAVSLMNELADVTPPTAEDVGSLGDKIREQAKAARESGDAMKYLTEQGYSTATASRILKDTLAENTTALGDNTDAGKEAAQAAYTLTQKQRLLNDEMNKAKTRFEEATFAFKQFMDELSDEEAIVAIQSAMKDINQELIDTGVISDDSRLRLERMFATTIGSANLLASTKFKVAVDTGELERAQSIIDQINAAAAAGATYLVSAEMYVGADLRNLMEGRGLSIPASSGSGSSSTKKSTPKADPISQGRETANALAAYYRNGGTRI